MKLFLLGSWVMMAVAFPLAAEERLLLAQPALSGEKIAFIYSEDLWIAELGNPTARRLTSDVSVESSPHFSPDGKTIAFSAMHDGHFDVYTIPVEGGSPQRITTHPANDLVRGFTRDGDILFTSQREVHTARYAEFFTVPITGGMPKRLAIPWGFEGAFSPDGKQIVYAPNRNVTLQWKHYRGGTNGQLWIFDFATQEIVKIPQPKERCNDYDPVWMGGIIYFRSDRDGEFNLYAYDIASKSVERLTHFSDFPILALSGDTKRVVFEQAGRIHLYDPKAKESKPLAITPTHDAPEARERFARGTKWVRDVSLSPSGVRAAVEFRGEIVTVPVEKGDPLYVTSTPGAHEREPVWSPDGKSIAYVSDESGEYEIVVAATTGKEKKRYHPKGSGYYSALVWSPDSQSILFHDNALTLRVLKLESGQFVEIAKARRGFAGEFHSGNWSPDSRWVAYALNTSASTGRIHLYSVDKAQSFPLGDGLAEAASPCFDASGKFLHFLGSNDVAMHKHGFSQSAHDAIAPHWRPYLFVLAAEEKSPFLRESDEEKGAEMKDEKSDKKETLKEDKSDKKEETKEEKKAEKKPKRTVIDLEGIDRRIVAFPLPQSTYFNLRAGSEVIYYRTQIPATPTTPATSPLHRYDIGKRKDIVLVPDAAHYEVQGKKLLYAVGSDYFVGSSETAVSKNPPPEGGDKKLNLEAIEVRVVPREEWKQIYHEAWRINRDMFYAPNMHGADWEQVRKKYEPFLPHATNSGDVYRIIRWMLSELAVGHSYITTFGERVHLPRKIPGGLLGADFEVVEGRFKIKKIYGQREWAPEARSPLAAPGVHVREGEFLLAVQGKELKGDQELYAPFENTAGKNLEITVGSTADGKNSRTVRVVPIESELPLRNQEWTANNLKKVEEATKGRVGYVYVPDTARNGMESFKKYFFPQIDKDALIIDERYNSGGQIADYYIDILRRPFASYWATRHGEGLRSPGAAVFGPKVLIADENAGSGGDMFPYMFRKFGIGPIVGKRTWGGLVGIGGYPILMDGGRVTAPSLAIWVPDGGFIIENEGVPPDYEVEMTPKEILAGKDPQLEKAIALVLEELRKNPPKKDAIPPYPERAKPKAPGTH